MIELRWILLHGYHGRGISYGSEGQAGEWVLQFRERTNLEEIGIQPPIWGDWQEVKIGAPV